MSGKSELKINSKFASKYEKYRQREELQRLKDRYGAQGDESDSGSSESESDEDSEVELDPQQDKDFYRTLSLLKKKDPKIYQTDTQFYTEPAGSGSTGQPSSSQKPQKAMFLKDYERKVILERGGKYDDDEEEESDDEEAVKRRERAASPSYIQEQRDLKESFRHWVQDSEEEEGSGGEEPLLTRRSRTQEEKEREEQDYVEWLKGQAQLQGPEELQDLSYLREYWNDPQLDEKERFLRDFVLNKAYLEGDQDRVPSYDEVVQEEVQDSSEEGEDFLLKQEVFERHYNFRFEEPDSQKIKTYPRSIATSVRCSDERRREARALRRDRKERERLQKQQQLQHMKNLKREEILGRLQRLQQLTGSQEDGFSLSHLQGDFNPEQHDMMMQEMFGEQYYGEDEEEKPQFDDEEQEDHWNWDTWTGEEGVGGEGVGGEEEGGKEEEEEEGEEPNCEDPDFIMDADYDPSQPSSSKKKKRRRKEDAPLMGKRKRKSHFAEVITKDKPVFDPQEKSFQQYLDEYYKLDYEDIIDDLPCRFRYRQVLPNNFGLTTDEILGSDEKDLNRWCSLKKTCMFRSDKEEKCDLKNYQIKAQNVKKKREVLSSFYSEEDGMEEGKRTGKKRIDRLKKPEEEEAGQDHEEGPKEGAEEGPAAHTQAGQEEEEEFLVPKKKRREEERTPPVEEKADGSQSQAGRVTRVTTGGPRKTPFRHPGGRLIQRPFRVKMGGREFSGQRLKAYGLNPKRLHFRQLGRQRNKAQRKSQE
ncbi:protein KRI1 homolog isoform X2 [Osmerus mordax]|uniref:protein KRI1 homolog isoform X2 n=1 Tax=Osmerus mordax TaxID=8014 RepID=UPI00350FA01E